jgi:hypothetical protein
MRSSGLSSRAGRATKRRQAPPTMATRRWLAMEERKRAQQRLQRRRRIVLEQRSHACSQHTQQSRWNEKRPERLPPGRGVQTAQPGSNECSAGAGWAVIATAAAWEMQPRAPAGGRVPQYPSQRREKAEGQRATMTQRRLGEKLGA